MRYILLLATSIFLSSCATTPPSKTSNICSIFMEKSSWYRHAYKAENRWKIPIPVSMAFMLQESSFKAKARTPRTKLLGFIPWKRKSSSLGYSQAINSVWSEFQKATHNPRARRKSFKDSINFIGWYNNLSHKKLEIARDDSYNMYLAYHEGRGGYKRKTWQKKPELLTVARKVQKVTNTYKKQLSGCRKKLKKTPWWWLLW